MHTKCEILSSLRPRISPDCSRQTDQSQPGEALGWSPHLPDAIIITKPTQRAMPDSVLNTLPILNPQIHSSAASYYHPHFSGGESEAQGVR